MANKKTSKKVAATPVDSTVPSELPSETVETPVETGDQEKKAPTEKVLPVTLGNIHISRPRSKFYLKKYLNSFKFDGLDISSELVDSLKETQKTLTPESEEFVANKAKIDSINKALIRTNYFAPHTISIICDYVIKDMIMHAIDELLQTGKKTLDLSHFYMGNVKDLKSYSIFSHLPTYSNTDYLSKEKKKAADEVVESVETDSSQNMSFMTYITNAINWIKSEKGVSITIGTRVKKYFSDLIIDLIKKAAVLTRSLLKLMNIRTVSPEHIKTILHMMMISGNASDEHCSELGLFIDEKLTVFKAAENDKAAIDDDADTKKQEEVVV
jgi:hypothetical protein